MTTDIAIEKPLVIISGGSGFIGSAVVEEFLQQGWNVAVVSRSGNAPVGSRGYACDVTDCESVKHIVNQIVKELGIPNALIHAAAAPLERTSLLDTSSPSFINTVEVALYGAYHLAISVIPHMSKGGVFIGITSQAIEKESSIQPSGAYLPAKYALRGFLRVLASDVRTSGIRVYAVAPNFLSGGLNDDLPEKVRNFIAHKLGTFGSEKDIAAFLFALVYDEEKYPSGSSLTFPQVEATPL